MSFRRSGVGHTVLGNNRTLLGEGDNIVWGT
jgi:hypothetical protein